MLPLVDGSLENYDCGWPRCRAGKGGRWIEHRKRGLIWSNCTGRDNGQHGQERILRMEPHLTHPPRIQLCRMAREKKKDSQDAGETMLHRYSSVYHRLMTAKARGKRKRQRQRHHTSQPETRKSRIRDMATGLIAVPDSGEASFLCVLVHV